MHIVHVVAVVILLTMVGVEFSVFAFFNPAAWQLAPEPQSRLLSRLAVVLGRVMPVWYPAGMALLVLETWLHRHTGAFAMLLAASALWFVASLSSIFFLVPLNNRVASLAPDWESVHHTWDTRHRIRTAALALAAILFTSAVVA